MTSPRVTWNKPSAAPGAMYPLAHAASPPRPTPTSPTPPSTKGLRRQDTSPFNLPINTAPFPTATLTPSQFVELHLSRKERGCRRKGPWVRQGNPYLCSPSAKILRGKAPGGQEGRVQGGEARRKSGIPGGKAPGGQEGWGQRGTSKSWVQGVSQGSGKPQDH